ncbi:MAG: TIGR00266 family protein [Synechocystis sp.]|nr:TIGR00266 family protein [Synechocystis sp.]
MLYKIRYGPAYSVLNVTLKPQERFYAALGTLVNIDEGLTLKRSFGAGFLDSLARFCLGKDNLMLNVIHNPTDDPLSFTLSKTFPGDITRLNVTKHGLVIRPHSHIAHTSGVQMGVHWLGFSSWLAGQGLIGLKLSGRGRVFLGSYGSLVQSQCNPRFMIEHQHLLAFSPKLSLKVNFPKGVIGDPQAGNGLCSQLTGSGSVYWQTRSLSSLGRYIRLKLR